MDPWLYNLLCKFSAALFAKSTNVFDIVFWSYNRNIATIEELQASLEMECSASDITGDYFTQEQLYNAEDNSKSGSVSCRLATLATHKNSRYACDSLLLSPIIPRISGKNLLWAETLQEISGGIFLVIAKWAKVGNWTIWTTFFVHAWPRWTILWQI